MKIFGSISKLYQLIFQTGSSTLTINPITQTGNTQLNIPDLSSSTPDTLTTAAVAQTLTNKTIADALTFAKISSPTAPSSGYDKLYVKADDKLYKKTSAGVESLVGGGLTPIVPTVSLNAFVAVDSTHALVDFSAASADITATLPTAVAGSSVAFSAYGNSVNVYRLVLVPAAGQTITVKDVAYTSTDSVKLLPCEDWCQLNWDGSTWRVDSNESFVSGTFAGDLVVTGLLTPKSGIVGKIDGGIVSSGNIGEVIFASPAGIYQTSPTLNTYYYDSGTLPLSAGVWMIHVNQTVEGDGPTLGGTDLQDPVILLGLFLNNNTLLTETGVLTATVPNKSDLCAGNLIYPVNINTFTTYKIGIAAGSISGLGSWSAISTSTTPIRGYFYAVRIA